MPISKRASPRKDGVQARKKLRTSVVDEEVKDKVNALDAWPDIRELLTNERVAVFLDYDGTLTPIVNDPAEAKICEEMRHVVSRLAHCMPTAIVTGRNIKTITDFMRLDHLFYAASHGFDIVSPEGRETHFEKVGDRFLPHLRKFRRNITKKVSDIEAAQVEDNTYAISVHYRNVQGEDDVRRVADAVDAELANYPGLLRRSDGKMVHEIKPVIDWDKGKALDWLLQHGIQNGPSMVPCYIGDDVTDEDAFRAVAKNKKGISIHVREPGKARHTDAQYVLSDPNQVQQFLQLLATLPQPQENGGNGDGGTKKVNGRSKAHHRLHRGEDDGKPADEDHAAEREEKAGSILTRSALALRRPPSPPKLGSPASSAGSAISSSSSTSSSSSPSGHASAAGVSAKRRRKKKSTMTKKKKRTGNSKAVAV